MKRNRSILKIITYTLYIIISFVILIFILYYSKNKEIKFILSSIGIWFLFFLFCVYKICRARKRAGFFEKGIYDAVDSGRDFYECNVAVVLTNSYFSRAAQRLADKIGVVLWDRDMFKELL